MAITCPNPITPILTLTLTLTRPVLGHHARRHLADRPAQDKGPVREASHSYVGSS